MGLMLALISALAITTNTAAEQGYADNLGVLLVGINVFGLVLAALLIIGKHSTHVVYYVVCAVARACASASECGGCEFG